MALTVGLAFLDFDNALELSSSYEDTATRRCRHLIELLEGDFAVVEAFPSGSIPRGTAVSGLADLDVIVVLEDWELVAETPASLLQRVRDSLGQRKTNVRKNGQAVTLHYESWPKVDVVPAGRVLTADGNTDYLLIPDMHRGCWLRSRPRKHSRAIDDRYDWSGYRFLDIVRMIKWWNYAHSGLLQSFHIETLALKTLPWTLDEYTWPIFKFFDEGASLVSKPLPWEGTQADSYLTSTARLEALKRMRTAASQASHAWFLTYNGRAHHREAIELWRQVFPVRFPSYG